MKMYEVYRGGPMHGYRIEIGPNRNQRETTVHPFLCADGTVRDIRYDRSDQWWRDDPDHGPEYIVMDFKGPNDLPENLCVQQLPITTPEDASASHEGTEADDMVAEMLAGMDDDEDGDPVGA